MSKDRSVLNNTILKPTAGDFRRLTGTRISFVHKGEPRTGTVDNVVKGNVIIEGEVFVQKDIDEVRVGDDA